MNDKKRVLILCTGNSARSQMAEGLLRELGSENQNGTFSFSNAAQPVKSAGFETNLRASYDIVKLFAGYTYTNAKAKYLAGNQFCRSRRKAS